MPTYTVDDLDDLEDAAENATEAHLSTALTVVAGLFEANSVVYGVMGGMNFNVRGSGRTTHDVDIAVDNRPRMDALLSIFDNRQDIHRPANKMQWASGVARIFVNVRGQLAQLDLMPKGVEGHLIPQNLAGSVDRLAFRTNQGNSSTCYFLAVGPLVKTKIKAHYQRESDKDYQDLRFVCKSSRYAPLVREAAPGYRRGWKDCFLDNVLEKHPADEQQIRWALDMPRTPSPDRNQPPGPDPRDNGRGGNGGSSSSDGRSGRGGQSGSSKSGHSRDNSSSASRGAYESGRGNGSSSSSSKQHKTSGSSSTTRQPSSSSAPRDGDKSSDGYWKYSAKDKAWYHKHSDGKYSWSS